MGINPNVESPKRGELADVLRRAGGARVIVLGDVMLDRQVMGAVQRLSPEAPVPVLRPSSTGLTAGGAANVALNVASMGALATLIGAIGADEAADILTGLVDSHPLTENRMVRVPGRPTTVKTRYTCGGQQLLRVDEEETSAIRPEHQDQILKSLKSVIGEADVLVLSDYGKGLLCDEVLRPAIAMAREAGAAIVVDPKRADLSAYSGASIITPNEHEARAAAGIDAGDDAGAAVAARAIIDKTSIPAVVVTRSSKGFTIAQNGAATQHVATSAREVADVSGAGDTFVAALATGIAGGSDLRLAARLANVAAGIAVGRHGTAVVSAYDIENALVLRDLTSTDRKIVTPEEAAACADAWRAQGLRVGFTNGCFDLVHPGHVTLLAQARAACDKLIVGLNSDASVARLKGPMRPLQGEVARATVLASFAAVDLVVIFSDDTPLALIEAIRPALLVKGADYRREQVVGAGAVEAWGGEVMLVELEQGHSTSSLVLRVRDQQLA